MKSPAWGEHRARYWLDAARYGDTHGLHFDNYREMWPYRDWVDSRLQRQSAFRPVHRRANRRRSVAQSDGDQLIATGFQRCNITTNEGGTIDEENLAIYAADRVQTFGWVYLGLTTNCSQCHDHKFDPFTHEGLLLAGGVLSQHDAAGQGRQREGRPRPVAGRADRADKPRWKALPAEIAAAQANRDERKQNGSRANRKVAGRGPKSLDEDVPTKDSSSTFRSMKVPATKSRTSAKRRNIQSHRRSDLDSGWQARARRR